MPACQPKRHSGLVRFPLLPQVLLCLYPFLWFRLYSFLFRQRRKKLQPTAAAARKKRQ